MVAYEPQGPVTPRRPGLDFAQGPCQRRRGRLSCLARRVFDPPGALFEAGEHLFCREQFPPVGFIDPGGDVGPKLVPPAEEPDRLVDGLTPVGVRPGFDALPNAAAILGRKIDVHTL